MNPERLDRMRHAMERARLDALVLRLPENVLLLSGFWPMIGATTLVFPREGAAVALIPAYYQKEAEASLWGAEPRYYPFGVLGAPDPMEALSGFLRDAARRKGWRRIGYEGNFPMLAPS